MEIRIAVVPPGTATMRGWRPCFPAPCSARFRCCWRSRRTADAVCVTPARLLRLDREGLVFAQQPVRRRPTPASCATWPCRWPPGSTSRPAWCELCNERVRRVPEAPARNPPASQSRATCDAGSSNQGKCHDQPGNPLAQHIGAGARVPSPCGTHAGGRCAGGAAGGRPQGQAWRAGAAQPGRQGAVVRRWLAAGGAGFDRLRERRSNPAVFSRAVATKPS